MARYDFKLLAELTDVEVIARGNGVRARHYLNRRYGHGNWRKMKGVALVEYDNGEFVLLSYMGSSATVLGVRI